MSARNVFLLIYAACVAYIGYEAYTYSGLYRWFAEWEIAHLGSYSLKLTFFAALLVPCIPLIVVARLFGVSRGQQPRAVSKPASPAGVFLVGLVALAAGAGLLWYANGAASAPATTERFDLSKDPAPKSSHVTISGIVHPEYIVTLEHKDSLFDSRPAQVQNIDRYIPLTAPTWRKGDPLVYFMRTNIDAVVMPAGGVKMLSPSTPPFAMTTEPGVLVAGDMPGPVAEVYRKKGVALGPELMILDFSPAGGQQTLFIVAAVACIFGACCLLAAAMQALFKPRRARA
jgi:hypothetical protein